MLDDHDELTASARARVGTVLCCKWRLDTLLGVGGMAAVYAATHRNGARVAIKILHPQLSVDQSIRDRFLREGYVANSVNHPGVVRVLDDDVTDDGAVFFVMDLLEGETLDARWSRQGPRLAAQDVLAIGDQVLDVLAAAHDRGVIHRDVKPENVFVANDGTVRLLDFGIARLRELSAASQATRAGAMLGTPAFMPPEQALGHVDEIDARSDLWGVGATMFALLTGRLVHEGGTVNEQLIAAATKPAPPLRVLAPDLPLPVREVVDRALAFDKNSRWPDARTMQEAVRAAYSVLGEPDCSGADCARRAEPVASAGAVAIGSVQLPKGPSGSRPATPTTGGASSVGATIAASKPGSPRLAPVVLAAAAALAGVGALSVLGVPWVVKLRAARHVAPDNGRAWSWDGAGAAAESTGSGPPGASNRPPASSTAEGGKELVGTDGVPSAPAAARTSSSAPSEAGPGRLTITSRGGACAVSVAGRAHGPTPLVGLEVAAANHLISCRTPRGLVLTQTARVASGETTQVVFVVPPPGSSPPQPMDRRR
jgi:serine/threonine-protein kinase